MHRGLTVLIVFVAFALAPIAASSQTTSAFLVRATGRANTSLYYYSSEGCNTSPDAVTYMYRGGPSFRAFGLAPSNGSVYEEFNAVGSSAWGKAYFFHDGSDKAFEFWFQGTLSCLTANYGVVSGEWTDAFAYAQNQTTGQTLCTRLSGQGKVVVYVDFNGKATATYLSGSYSAGEPQPCS